MNGPHGYLKDCLPSGKSESEVRQQRLSMVDVIGKAALPRGMSDDQLANERQAQEAIDMAIRAMSNAILKVNTHSAVMKINWQRWRDFMDDELPEFTLWDERISDARS